MAVLRITTNLLTSDPQGLGAFYADIFGLDLGMDLGFIVTMQSGAQQQSPQLSLATEGGAKTPLPVLSIEVDDLNDVTAQAKAKGITIEYGPVTEDWGVRRLFLRDPAGHLINVLEH